MNKQRIHTQQIILYAFAMTIVFVATLHLKTPYSLDGYFNWGYGFILLLSSLLGPFSEFLVGGLDGALLTYLFHKYGNATKWITYTLNSLLMVAGYFFAKWNLKGSLRIALRGVAKNIVQSSKGFAVSILCFPILQKQGTSSLIFSKFQVRNTGEPQ